jgi:hypothetical protein
MWESANRESCADVIEEPVDFQILICFNFSIQTWNTKTLRIVPGPNALDLNPVGFIGVLACSAGVISSFIAALQ